MTARKTDDKEHNMMIGILYKEREEMMKGLTQVLVITNGWVAKDKEEK